MIEAVTAIEAPEVLKKKPRGRQKQPPQNTISQHESVVEAEIPEVEETRTAPEAADAAPYPPIPPKTSFDTLTNYWNNVLTSAQRKEGTVYLYRLVPKMKLLPGRGGRMVNANCEKFNDEDGPITKDLIRNRRRMGVYLLRLNQRAVKPSCEVSNCEVELHGDITDPTDMPILDVENLDLANEGNRSYIQVLRSRGILKADAQDVAQGEEMAASDILGDIATRAMDKLGNQPQQPAQTAQATDLAGVVTPIIGLLKEQINQNKPPAQQGTVLDMVTALSNLAKTNTPAPQDMAPFMELQRQNNELVRAMMQKDVERAESEARKARDEAEAYKQAIPKPKTIDEQFDELERAAKRYERITGKKRGAEDEGGEEATPAAGAGGLLGTIAGYLPLVERIFAHGANMLYNWKLNGSGAAPLNPGTQQPDRQPAPPDTAPPADAAAEPANDEEAQRMELMQNVVNILMKLEEPMIKYFLEGKPGGEFAKFTIDNYGMQAFATVGSLPKANLLNMLSTYPPVWNVVGPRIQEYSKFLDEFLSYKSGTVQ